MTLLEAVNSGRRFRKVGSNAAYAIPELVPTTDLGADFELEPTPATVTRELLAAAWNQAFADSRNVGRADASGRFAAMATALGL